MKEEDKKWLIGKLGNSPPKWTSMVSLHQRYFILRRDGHYGLLVSSPAMGVHSWMKRESKQPAPLHPCSNSGHIPASQDSAQVIGRLSINSPPIVARLPNCFRYLIVPLSSISHQFLRHCHPSSPWPWATQGQECFVNISRICSKWVRLNWIELCCTVLKSRLGDLAASLFFPYYSG